MFILRYIMYGGWTRGKEGIVLLQPCVETKIRWFCFEG